jgi:hypothetical protein
MPLILPSAPGHSVDAIYAGDDNYLPYPLIGEFSRPVSQIVRTPSPITLSSSSPITLGASATITATMPVSHEGFADQLAPTGTIRFLEGSTELASATLLGGRATVRLPSLPLGIHNVAAVYSGDIFFSASSASTSIVVRYEPAGSLCRGEAGHQILGPGDALGENSVKQGRVVPIRFRVCDSHGQSIGTPDVVSSFAGVESATPFSQFRWDPAEQQWVFNIATTHLDAGKSYVFPVALNDGTAMTFRLTLR